MGAAPPKAPSLVTKQQYDAAIAGEIPKIKAAAGQFGSVDYNDALQSFKDTMAVLPPPAPDLADQDIQRARQAKRRQLLMGGMTGPIDLSGGAAARPLPGLGGT